MLKDIFWLPTIRLLISFSERDRIILLLHSIQFSLRYINARHTILTSCEVRWKKRYQVLQSTLLGYRSHVANYDWMELSDILFFGSAANQVSIDENDILMSFHTSSLTPTNYTLAEMICNLKLLSTMCAAVWCVMTRMWKFFSLENRS